jgi:hypothetical protein
MQTDPAAAIETIRILLVVMLPLLALLFLTPVQCEHPCHPCAVRRAEEAADSRRRQHDYWHGEPADTCRRCNRKDSP